MLDAPLSRHEVEGVGELVEEHEVRIERLLLSLSHRPAGRIVQLEIGLKLFAVEDHPAEFF